MTAKTKPAVRFRKLRPDELPAVMSIDAATWPERPLPEIEWVRALIVDGYTCAVAIEGARIVGFCLYAVRGEFIQIAKLAVLPERQGHGVGTALLCRFERTLRVSGRSFARLNVRTSNERAVGLYRRLGWQTLRTAKDHYGPGDDALVMILEVAS